MKIILIGAGRVGSAIAFQLALGGHEVAVVARGARLETLQRDQAIVTVDGRRTPIVAMAGIETKIAYDLAIVTVPEHQIDPLLPELVASSARQVLLMFNTFEGVGRYRDRIGAARFAFGFPTMTAFLVDDRLRHRVTGPGLVCTLSDAALVELFRAAGMPAEFEADMDAFLRSHVAMAVPLLAAGLLTWHRDTELSWSEARRVAAAWAEGFGLVRALGHPLKPGIVAALARLPGFLLTALAWGFGRSTDAKNVGEFGPVEVRWLIDAMARAASKPLPHLQRIRP